MRDVRSGQPHWANRSGTESPWAMWSTDKKLKVKDYKISVRYSADAKEINQEHPSYVECRPKIKGRKSLILDRHSTDARVLLFCNKNFLSLSQLQAICGQVIKTTISSTFYYLLFCASTLYNRWQKKIALFKNLTGEPVSVHWGIRTVFEH